jgi:hypothetical protein
MPSQRSDARLCDLPDALLHKIAMWVKLATRNPCQKTHMDIHLVVLLLDDMKTRAFTPLQATYRP